MSMPGMDTVTAVATVNRASIHGDDRENYETPRHILDPLNDEFGFKVDLAADDSNHLCPSWFGPRAEFRGNSLEKDWYEIAGPFWLNPPYGRGIGRWVRKAYEESAKGALIVALLPANTDTAWFHDWVLGKAELRWIRGRVQFTIDGKRPVNEKTGKTSGNSGGSVIAIYRPFGGAA